MRDERGVCCPVLYLFKLGTKKAESELDKWFDQLRKHGKKLGVEVEPLTVRERIYLEHDARWTPLSLAVHDQRSDAELRTRNDLAI